MVEYPRDGPAGGESIAQAGFAVFATRVSLVTARLPSDRFDLNRLALEIRRLDDPAADGGSDTVEEVTE